jgi:hypothetical protein
MRGDPAGDVAKLARLKESNAALWKRVRESEAEDGLRGDPDAATPDLALELQRVYDSEMFAKYAIGHLKRVVGSVLVSGCRGPDHFQPV